MTTPSSFDLSYFYTLNFQQFVNYSLDFPVSELVPVEISPGDGLSGILNSFKWG